MRFDVEWIENQLSDSEEALTRCHMGLKLRDQQLFRHENLLGEHQVRDSITVSAYPWPSGLQQTGGD